MERADADYREIIARRGLSEGPPEKIEALNYSMRYECWYLKAGGLWYWHDARPGSKREGWLRAPLGPM